LARKNLRLLPKILFSDHLQSKIASEFRLYDKNDGEMKIPLGKAQDRNDNR